MSCYSVGRDADTFTTPEVDTVPAIEFLVRLSFNDVALHFGFSCLREVDAVIAIDQPVVGDDYIRSGLDPNSSEFLGAGTPAVDQCHASNRDIRC